jgi:polyvinyl alcohol dehydrogenase (cytochrome)
MPNGNSTRPLFLVLALLPGTAGAQPNGQALFEKQCASCHTGQDPRAPAVATLRQRTPEALVEALTTGVMSQQGAALTDAERRAVAAFLSAGTTAAAAPSTGRCSAPPPFDPSRTAQWNGWSPDVTNARFQTTDRAGLTAERAPKLMLKWAFGLPNATSARGVPTVVGGRVFFGGEGRTVYSLDAQSGCIVWTFEAASGVRSAISVGSRAGGGTTAYFGDSTATVYAVDAENGRMLWTQKLDPHPFARITGSPTLVQDRLYVPVSSLEEGQGTNPKYECCTFRGSIVALETATGRIVWQTHTMDAAKPIGKNRTGTTRWGPSGAAIWTSPTVDAKRRLVYAATGNMYTEPQQRTSDAVIAFSMDDGRIAWTAQVTPKDVFVVGCGAKPGANCPDDGDLGPDFDFGNSPMLATVPGGRQLLLIGQKSGVGWALDPDNKGAVVWQYRAGEGGALGGMEWGSAFDGERVYFPVADVFSSQPGGLHAVDPATGRRVWYAPPPPPACGTPSRTCNGALSAAITAIPGVVFAGSHDGAVRAHDAKTGTVIWEFNTNREFTTVNGVAGRGGSINGPGPIVAGGMLYLNSGYASFNGRPGNVLLAFGIE